MGDGDLAHAHVAVTLERRAYPGLVALARSAAERLIDLDPQDYGEIARRDNVARLPTGIRDAEPPSSRPAGLIVNPILHRFYHVDLGVDRLGIVTRPTWRLVRGVTEQLIVHRVGDDKSKAAIDRPLQPIRVHLLVSEGVV